MNWMLSQFYTDQNGDPRPVCWSYSNGYICPQHPGDLTAGWALVKCESGAHQIDAAKQDPRVQVYLTPWDTLTAETVTAYAAKGATAGMMFGQLLALLASSDSAYGA
jgi:hypothetical protein